MKIAIGSDHAGFPLKAPLKEHIISMGHEVVDYGTDSLASCDYPVYGEKVGRAVASGECDLGVLICGTGCGISIAANKVPGVRACNCSEPYTAALSRRHNNANIIAVGSRVVGDELAKLIVESFINAEFEGGRHARRVALIDAIH